MDLHLTHSKAIMESWRCTMTDSGRVISGLFLGQMTGWQYTEKTPVLKVLPSESPLREPFTAQTWSFPPFESLVAYTRRQPLLSRCCLFLLISSSRDLKQLWYILINSNVVKSKTKNPKHPDRAPPVGVGVWWWAVCWWKPNPKQTSHCCKKHSTIHA